MDNLLKLLPLMDMPESIRQPLLLDVLAGRGNAMVGFVAARQASDAAISVVAEKDQATAANATTMARLATFHAALVKTGTLPDDLKVFETFKTKLLANEASATEVGSSIMCTVVDVSNDEALEKANADLEAARKEHDEALKKANDDLEAAKNERDDALARLEAAMAGDAGANPNAVMVSRVEAFHEKLVEEVTLPGNLGNFNAFAKRLKTSDEEAGEVGVVIRNTIRNSIQ